jgi:hypothetical protein
MMAHALTQTLRGIRRTIGGSRLALACLAAATPLSAQARDARAPDALTPEVHTPRALAAGRSAGWSWAGPMAAGATLEVRLVRGSLRAVTVEGPDAAVVLVRRSVRSSPGSAHVVVARAGRGIRIEDRYPRRSTRRGEECLPPDDGRGDFWHSDVRLETVVRVPRGVRLVAHLMSGDVDVSALAGPRDVSTNDGAVRGAARNP